MLTLEYELLEDLTAELSETDKNFNQSLIISKIKNAIREVKQARNYPKYYTDGQIEIDMYKYFSNIRNIALYDYNQIGSEYESGHSENSISRNWIDRNSLFNGIYPFVKII